MPSITIMLPIYCEDQDVALQLEGLADQPGDEIEILVVDACGKGATSRPAEQVLKADERAVALPGQWDNIAVMRALVDVGYDGWVFVEQDTHMQDPLKDLAISREYLREAGF